MTVGGRRSALWKFAFTLAGSCDCVIGGVPQREAKACPETGREEGARQCTPTKHSRAWEESGGEEVERTTLKDGSNPMLEWYENVKVMF